jgi:hypothetical protein
LVGLNNSGSFFFIFFYGWYPVAEDDGGGEMELLVETMENNGVLFLLEPEIPLFFF